MQHTLKISLLGLALFGFQAHAQDDAPKTFLIEGITINGTGCTSADVASNISDDQQAFTLTFNNFWAEVGPTVGVTRDQKNCVITFNTKNDANWEYAILAVNFRGFAQLDEGVKGSQNVLFPGAKREQDATLELVGPLEEDYISSREVALDNLKWSGCKDNNKPTNFSLKSNILLQAGRSGGSGLLTVDSVDGEIQPSQEYELLWRDCKNPEKAIAICRLSVPNKKSVRTLLSKGQAPIKKDDSGPTLAKTRARAKMAKKCDKLNRRGIACDASKAVCTALTIPK